MKNPYATEFTSNPPTPEENQHMPFQRKRKNTTTIVTIIICAVLALFLLIGGIIFAVFSLGRNHPSFVASVEYIETSAEVREYVGNIDDIRTQGFSINTSGGFGEAEHTMRVTGDRGSAVVRIQLTRVPGQCWQIIESEVFHLP